MDRKGFATNEHDHDLARNYNQLNANEPNIAMHSLEDVELVVNATAAILVVSGCVEADELAGTHLN